MGDKTGIEWTDKTWNPWHGCHKVSAGCKNCYMYREKLRYGQDPATVVRSSWGTFRRPLTWHEPGLVFTCSWSDFFIEEADAWRPEAWAIIRQTPRLTYQILTKRPERIADHLPSDWGKGWANVWLGVTVENELTRWRIPEMMKSPAASYFVSVEPMLGPVDLREYLPIRLRDGAPVFSYRMGYKVALDHVICGCESGPQARPTELNWVRDLRDQCQADGVPFFLKQLMLDGRLVKMPELDGRQWAEMPKAAGEVTK